MTIEIIRLNPYCHNRYYNLHLRSRAYTNIYHLFEIFQSHTIHSYFLFLSSLNCMNSHVLPGTSNLAVCCVKMSHQAFVQAHTLCRFLRLFDCLSQKLKLIELIISYLIIFISQAAPLVNVNA